MVEQYKNLRQRDSSGVAKSSWRITVRQLESMIRLSEGLARLHCSDCVSPKHVTEAYRLLNKSIIRVETPDIQFDEEEQEQGWYWKCHLDFYMPLDYYCENWLFESEGIRSSFCFYF